MLQTHTDVLWGKGESKKKGCKVKRYVMSVEMRGKSSSTPRAKKREF